MTKAAYAIDYTHLPSKKIAKETASPRVVSRRSLRHDLKRKLKVRKLIAFTLI